MRMEHQAVAIRAEVGRLEGRRGRGKEYPEALRQQAVAYYRVRRAAGATMKEIGLELGMSWQTLQRWASATEDAALVATNAPGFALVEVVEAATTFPKQPITVRGPAGLSIEGLDLDTLVELLRRLA